MAKKITMEDLAVMTARGFQENQKQFEGLKKDVSELKTDVSGLKTDVSGLKKEMSDFRNHVDSRLDLLEKEVRDIRQKINQGISRKEFFEIEERLTIIEDKLGIQY